VARRRTISAVPARTTAATWQAITELVICTLARSSGLDGDQVRAELAQVRPAAVALIAGGYTNRESLTLRAGPLYLKITTCSGTDALKNLEDENANPVPGAATATDWTLHLPCPNGHADLLAEVLAGLEHVTTDKPPAETESTQANSLSPVIDLRGRASRC
jgi:hypothetical protein